MRFQAFLILIAAIFVVTGCGGRARYDGRLVQADSLMWTDADSAMAILSAIDTLSGAADSAYRDLLLTQARYKTYQDITASDDSAITRALHWYRAHSGEREKLTRANLYKGAVMEELDHIDSAMIYYKTAEAAADSTDFFTLGYVNMRMGALYRDHYSLDGKDIEKYERALKFLMLTDAKYYQLRCQINLGSLYRLNDPIKAETMLNDALSLAIEAKDTSAYLSCIQNKILLYDHYGKYENARALIHLIKQFPYNRISNLSLTTAARVYAKLGLIDSTDLFLDIIKNRSFNDPIDQLSLYEAMSAIALARGDSLGHLQYEHECKYFSDSLKSLQQTVTLLSVEREFDQTFQTVVNKQHRCKLIQVAVLCLIVIFAVLFIYYRRIHRYDGIIDSIKHHSAEQLQDLTLLKQRIENLIIKDEQLKSSLSSQLQLMKEMLDACYHSPDSILSKKVKTIFQYRHDMEKKWILLFDYIDAEKNGIISRTRASYPMLNDKDLLLIALISLDFSYIHIAIILGYSNATSVSTIKQRLAKKMHLNVSLNDYIDTMIKADKSQNL